MGNRTASAVKTNQFFAQIQLQKLLELNKKNVIHIKTDTYFLQSNDYFTNELYRFGGINSIRGFEENSINATLLSVLASEYRYQLSPRLYVHSIIDASYFETPTLSNQKLYGFGFGFGLLTDAGLLKFNLANGQAENQNFRFSDSKIHLSLTATF